ncbi:MAG: hypothetical protein ACI9WC_000520 [Arenicella sp.]|jgi:hypothetical protein
MLYRHAPSAKEFFLIWKIPQVLDSAYHGVLNAGAKANAQWGLELKLIQFEKQLPR